MIMIFSASDETTEKITKLKRSESSLKANLRQVEYELAVEKRQRIYQLQQCEKITQEVRLLETYTARIKRLRARKDTELVRLREKLTPPQEMVDNERNDEVSSNNPGLGPIAYYNSESIL